MCAIRLPPPRRPHLPHRRRRRRPCPGLPFAQNATAPTSCHQNIPCPLDARARSGAGACTALCFADANAVVDVVVIVVGPRVSSMLSMCTHTFLEERWWRTPLQYTREHTKYKCYRDTHFASWWWYYFRVCTLGFRLVHLEVLVRYCCRRVPPKTETIVVWTVLLSFLNFVLEFVRRVCCCL